MQAVAEKLVFDLGHVIFDVLYLVFNKTAQTDASEQMPGGVRCSTIHAQAKRILSFSNDRMKRMDDSEMTAFILERMGAEIDDFLSNVADKHKNYGKRRQVAFWIYKTLVRFMQSKDNEAVGFNPTVKRTCYYPAVKYYTGKDPRKKPLPGEPSEDKVRKFYCYCAKQLWSWLRVDPTTKSSECGRWTYDSVMKQVQVDGLEMSAKVILVDESQDLTPCQLSWVLAQKPHKQIFLVGDPAQGIYGFRGAKSESLAESPVDKDFNLTRSFRFGKTIAASANTLLYGKKNSPQGKKFVPYDVVGGANEPGQVCYHRKGTSSAIDDFLVRTRQDGDVAPSVTLLAYRNSSLIVAALEYLSKSPNARIAVYGGSGQQSNKKKVWSDTCKEIGHFYRLFADRGNSHEIPLNDFKDESGKYLHLSWDGVLAMVEELEMTKYNTHVSLINQYGVLTMARVEMFQERVLKAQVDPARCDILLSTIHAAKGAEWPNVVILDDLVELACFASKPHAKAEFDFKPYGDDINYWYVALTRAMRRVSVPAKLLHVVQSLERAIAIVDGHVPHLECMDPADGGFFLLPNRAGKKFTFETVLGIADLGRGWRRLGNLNGHAHVDITEIGPIEDGVEPEPNEPSSGAADEREG